MRVHNLCLILALTCKAGFSQEIAFDLKKSLRIALDSTSANRFSGIYHTLKNEGEIWSPASFRRSGRGTDSEMGVLSDSVFQIYFDIGFLAGAHIGIHNIEKYAFYYDTTVNGYKTLIGLIIKDDIKELIVTIYANAFFQNKPFIFPANFRAFISDEKKIAEALRIAISYSPIRIYSNLRQ